MKKYLLSLAILILSIFMMPTQNVDAAIKINKKTTIIYVGNTTTLKVTGTTKKVTWSSSNKKVATVKNGTVKAVKSGTAKITAKVGKKSYTCKVTVKNLSLNKKKLNLSTGSTYSLKLTGAFKKINWKTTNSKIAKVSKGKVSAVSPGTATIKAVHNGKTYSCKVTVKNIEVIQVKLNKTSATLAVGESLQLNATVTPTNATNKKVTWTTSNSNVATVTNGKVTAVNTGTALITAKSGKKTATCIIIVNSKFNPTEEAKKITYTAFKIRNEIVVIAKNNSKYNMSVEGTMVYYDKNKNMLFTTSENNYCFEAGTECVFTFIEPYDSNYDFVDYSTYSLNFAVEEEKSNISYIDYIKTTSNVGSNGVIVSATNTTSKTIDFTNATVLYYKGSNVVGSKTYYLDTDIPGSTSYTTFGLPYDDNYDPIEFDNYRVIINYSYSY